MEDKDHQEPVEEAHEESNIVFTPPEFNKISSHPVNVCLGIHICRNWIWRIFTLIKELKLTKVG